MTPERWRQITGIFQDALAHEAGQRDAFVDVHVATTMRFGSQSTSC